jgi:hypothetical protein
MFNSVFASIFGPSAGVAPKGFSFEDANKESSDAVEEDPVQVDDDLSAECSSVRAWALSKAKTFPSRTSTGNISWTPEQKLEWGETICKPIPDPSITCLGNAAVPNHSKLMRARGELRCACVSRHPHTRCSHRARAPRLD